MNRPALGQVVQISPVGITLAKGVDAMPELNSAPYEALKDDIRRRGVIEPLTLTWPAGQMVDGRARLRSALELGLPGVPVRYAQIADPLAHALDSALLRRRLTRTAAVLMLWDAHPDLVAERSTRKGGRPKTCDSIAGFDNDRPEPASWKAVAEKYRLPRDYFTMLQAAFDFCKTDDEIALVRHSIAVNETPATKLLTVIVGHRDGVDHEGVAGRDRTNHAILINKSLVSLQNCFAHWDELPDETRQQARQLWFRVLDAAPKEFFDSPAKGKGAA